MTTLDPLLLEVLACPVDKGPLLFIEGESLLYNPRLQRAYPVRDGVPVMLVDEAVQVDGVEHQRLMALAAETGAPETGTAGVGMGSHAPEEEGAPAPSGATGSAEDLKSGGTGAPQ